VDEASRVIDSEFLIGARQARRWVLVGDEHQLPPYVHSPDEQHLHALAALNMTERGAAPDLESAVKYLNTLWQEDEELHQLRTDPVQKTAERIRDNGQWRRTYRPAFQTAYKRLGRDDLDADRALLAAMRTHLVRSLFERCVQTCPSPLRERLTEQRRMIDPIAAIVRDPVYDGEYDSPPPADLLRHGVSPLTGETLREPVVLLDTSNQPKAKEDLRGTGFVNELEADWAVAVCKLWERELRRRGERKRITVSVLTLYGAQAKLIRSRLGHPHYSDFRILKIEKVDSIDAIQGQESDLVILSFCRTRRGRMGDGFGLWLQDVRRLNVACTRARRSLVLIGHRRTLERLSTIDEARAFYSHLFGLFDRKSPGTVVLRDLR
jgi:superfamily I DNA and/or RNA helicase